MQLTRVDERIDPYEVADAVEVVNSLVLLGWKINYKLVNKENDYVCYQSQVVAPYLTDTSKYERYFDDLSMMLVWLGQRLSPLIRQERQRFEKEHPDAFE